THADADALAEEPAPGNVEAPLTYELVGTPGVLARKDADDPDVAGRVDETCEVSDDDSWVLLFCVVEVASLEPHRVDGAVDTVHHLLPAPGRFPTAATSLVVVDLVDGVTLGEVDRDRAELAGLVEPLADVVNDIDDGHAAQSKRAIGGE